MKAVILVGGKGTRLKPLTDRMPKPMLPLAGRPMLEHLIIRLVRNGIRDIIICSGYKSGMIEKHFGDGKAFGADIAYSRETKPLGTAGPLSLIKEKLKDDFIVVYGDLYIELDFQKLAAFHKSRKACATLVLHPSDHPYDSDMVDIDNNGNIKAFLGRPKPGQNFRNLGNAAVYVLNPKALSYIPEGRQADFARDIFPDMLEAGELLAGYVTEEYVRDVGTMDRYTEVNNYIIGRIKALVFLDRDGVINEEVDLLHKEEQLRLLSGAAEAIKLLNGLDAAVVVVTNQPQVARNLCTEADVVRIHEKLNAMLAGKGAFLDGIYYCPHHPEKNHPEASNPKYRKECECRKPGTGMLEQARRDIGADKVKCFMVGDRTADIQTGKNAKCTAILVETGLGGKDYKFDVKPDYIVKDLYEASELIAGLI